MRQVNMTEFDELVQGDKPVLVDFFATWCGPCKIMAPILEQVEQTEIGQNFHFVKVDVDQSPDLSNRYDIMAVPTLAIFKGGEILYKQAGVHQPQQLVKVLQDNLA
ncbi:thioredoxin [Fastidiosipila sanguinis]|nr:thioredoxin [Fastidiosipila sanguinis]